MISTSKLKQNYILVLLQILTNQFVLIVKIVMIKLIHKHTIRHNQRVLGRPNKHLEVNTCLLIPGGKWEFRLQ